MMQSTDTGLIQQSSKNFGQDDQLKEFDDTTNMIDIVSALQLADSVICI